MNNEIIEVFNEQDVRIIQIDNKEWFVGKDVCSLLGYKNETDAMNRHCKGVVKRYPLLTSGGYQELRVLSDSDVMRLICSSKLPQAVEFERWVFEKILPSIRKTGTYIMPGLSQEAIMNVVTEFKSTVKKLVNQNHQLREENEYLRQYEPKCDFGTDSEITGRAKWLIRRGAYVSGRGRKAKCLKPTGCGCIQLNLFDDYLPMKNVIESMKLLGVNELNLSLI